MIITYKNKKYEFEKNIALKEISDKFKNEYKFEIILGKVNNDICELDYKVNEDCTVDFYDLTHHLGNKTYERGLVHLFINSVKTVLNSEVKIAHSLDKGVYCKIDKKITLEDIELIKSNMNETVRKNIPFEKVSIPRLKAIEYFKKTQRNDKANLLKYVIRSSILLYKLENTYDYFFGEMPLTTLPLKYFEIEYINEFGVVLGFPNIYLNGEIKKYEHPNKVFDAFDKNYDWANNHGIRTISDLNEIISSEKIDDLIYMNESYQNKCLFEISDKIIKNENLKIILIAGPSSSGKTTTSKKLSSYLKCMGKKPLAISIDDYFLDREQTPKDEFGKYDFESIKAIDVDLFNEHLNRLLNYDEILMPTYNFILGKKEYNKKIKLEKNGILIIEGLHALNNELTKLIPKENKYKIYISPLNVLNIDNHNRFTTSDVRLLRRIIRDNMNRGYNASKTLETWRSVRKGEEKYVFSFQNDNDIVINSSLIYELGILRTYAEPLLFSVKPEDPNYNEAIRLINLIRNVLPITGIELPYDSILREFIGNSYFFKIGDE